MNDSEIISALEQNNFAKAIGSLYKYRPAIKKMVEQYGGSKEDAEDIFQDALMILCRKIRSGGFALTSSLNTYLYSVSKNLWRDALRKQNKIPAGEITNDLSEEDKEFIASESQYTKAENAFAQLGEKCREILMQFYYYKKTMAEIAAMIGFANERVAKNQKYRCLEKAKENYAQLKMENK